MKQTKLLLAAISASLLFAGSAGAVEIKDVMKAAMKGDDSLYNKVTKGKGTDADAKKLAACVKNLTGKKAPRGDQAAFDRKVDALIKAADAVANGNKQAVSQLINAGACKACHSAHKPEK
ncbi:MAG: hypothetical protein K1X78_01775 [Verrucomicrobiaceae bacterium]|nr:hypothetical protein [Verrucomicrobiaceae bacterium]